MSHSSLPVALLASHLPCGSLWAAPKAPLGPRFPSGQFAALTRRKKASIAHFDGGARNVARNGVGQRSPTSGARSCSPFSAVKMGGPFSLRCLSPLCSAAAGTGQTQMALLGMPRCGLRGFAAQKNGLDFFFAAGTIHTQITSLGMRRYKLNIFVTQKASMDSYPRWPF